MNDLKTLGTRPLVRFVLENLGPISYRTLAYPWYDTKGKEYFDLDPNADNCMVHARKMGKRWNAKEWRVVRPDDTVNIRYLVRLGDVAPTFYFAQHEDYLNAIFFSYLNSPDFEIKEWEKVSLFQLSEAMEVSGTELQTATLFWTTKEKKEFISSSLN